MASQAMGVNSMMEIKIGFKDVSIPKFQDSVSHPESWLKFLLWFCPEHLVQEIESDLILKFGD